ncbi:hypothetical protein RP20_CCG020396 [Aedes albopictus]|nr:hypothetical protein RP20_CCG020396 [Aedes albopictus]
MVSTRLLKNLPLEVLEQIFSYLPLCDRKSVSLVCRSWNNIVFSRRFLKDVTLNLDATWDRSKVYYLRTSTRRYRNLFVFVISDTCSPYNFEFIEEILKLFGQELESFQCNTKLSAIQLRNVIECVPNILELIVEVDATTLNHEQNFPAIRRLHRLESVNNVLQIRSLDMPKLARLKAKFATSLDAMESMDVLRRITPQLRSLELVSKESFSSIDELRCPKVEVLKLSGEIFIGSDAVRAFFGGFKCLKDVRLDIDVDDVMLGVIIRACPGIENLHFKNQYFESDTFQLLERLENLKTLSIDGSIDYRIKLKCKPLVSVTRFCFQLDILEDEASVFNEFKQMLPNVVDLGITLFAPENLDSVLVHACQHFPGIRRLTIYDAALFMCTVTDAGYQILGSLDRLEELKVDSADVEVEFMQPMVRLKRLEYRFHSIADQELMMLADLYPDLKYLGISWCANVTAQGVREFRARLPGCVVLLD